MTTIYYTATSLDGFIADQDQSLDWLSQLGEPKPNTFEAFLAGVGAIAMGATTYQWLYDHHIAPKTGDSRPWPYSVPTWVFSSRRLPAITGADIRFVSGDVQPIHKEMTIAAGDNTLWIVGGGDLASQFYDCGLLDEIVVTIAAVTLGRGAPLFPRRIQPPLQLLSVQPMGDYFAELRYQVSYSQRDHP
ncbi:dihydrofolate reductase family protein [Halomicronema hongdechloris]|nr:dihydrofolate reductase family protein [Halomicronema hongdechloris]